MNLNKRKELLVRLGEYMQGNEDQWINVKNRASAENPWFIPEFIDLSINNILNCFLNTAAIETLISSYSIPQQNTSPRKVGIVMAGNIPLVGFHDFLCVLLSGHYADIKPSSKDEVLIKHLIGKLQEWDEEITEYAVIKTFIPHCDAYIATGSNNSSRYFEFYFNKYPSIIRKNRTSLAILSGKESMEDLEKLADDVYLYFGLGCRNVTKIYVPEGYDFVPLLEAFKKYNYLADHNKFKNNYDHYLALHILNNQYYMTNGSILLIENQNLFSPISELHYEFYKNEKEVLDGVCQNKQVQCIVGSKFTQFGKAQFPSITDYADGIDTMKFLLALV